MKRHTLNFTVDLAAFVVLVGMVVTSIIIRFVLPPGSGGRGRVMHGGQGGEQIKTFLNLGRHDWGDIHFYLAIAFATFMIIHIILHYNWIVKTTKNLCQKNR